MTSPVSSPVAPMLARAVSAVPSQEQGEHGPRWGYEPKWDGFRCVVHRDGDDVVLGSRSGKPLTRYFPELATSMREALPQRCVVDGEIVVPRSQEDGRRRLDWDSLSQRIHPAVSRVTMLSQETPAELVTFDLLALGDDDLRRSPFRERRAALEAFDWTHPRVHLTALTHDDALATDWFTRFEGAGLDGVVAKGMADAYQEGERVMVKVKHHRTADCVVVGYRPHKSSPGIGSMLLGLYPPGGGEPHMVGGASAFTAAKRRELLELLQPYRDGDGTRSGEPNRWNAREDHSWVPLRPELVCEVTYDQMEGDRFRHAARFVRWRQDKDPEQCTYDQLDVPLSYDLSDVLVGR